MNTHQTSGVQTHTYNFEYNKNISIKRRELPIRIGVLSYLLIILGCLIAGYLFSFAMFERMTPWVNQIFPIILLLSLLWAAFKIVRTHPIMVWTPLPWFFAACAVYYGLGPLVYYFGQWESVWYVDLYYPASEQDIFWTNLLNVISIAIVVLSFVLSSKTIFSIEPPRQIVFDDAKKLKRVVILFLSIGIPVKYLLGLPLAFGILGFTLPGAVKIFESFTTLAIIPLIILVAKGYGKWRILLYSLVASELLVSMATFAKETMLITLIITFLSWFFFVDQRLRTMVIGVLLILAVYGVISPLVSFARIELTKGNQFIARFANSFEMVGEYIKSERKETFEERKGIQSWWTRLSYTNAQAFAMNRYNSGLPGDTFSLAVYTIVPRVIWPDKPIITVGPQFNYLATGNPDSASAPGFFGEAYWNGGWFMVVVACLYVGILFAGITCYAIQQISNLELLFLPVIFIGIRAGFRPDDWFVATYVGTLTIGIFLHILLYFINKLITRGFKF